MPTTSLQKVVQNLKKLKVWINACEVSGDLQASLLLSELQKIYPDMEVIGMGGEHLHALGQKNLFHVNELSVMGITEIISAIPKIFKLWKRIKQSIKEEKPDVVILVDSGEFNFPIAKYVKNLGIPVYYFIPPKVWAWRKYRVKYLKKYVDKIFCILPFEVEFYKQHGIYSEYIQNPLVNALASYKALTFNKENTETIHFSIMPGSRRKEVTSLLPFFAKVASELYKKYPNSTYSIIQAPSFTQEYLESFWKTSENLPPVNFIQSNERYKALANSHFCLAASGTATLETALIKLPTIISYQVSNLTYTIAKIFMKIDFAGLASLIAGHEVFPEYIQKDMTLEKVMPKIYSWIENPEELEKLQKELDLVADKLKSDSTQLRIFDDIR